MLLTDYYLLLLLTTLNNANFYIYRKQHTDYRSKAVKVNSRWKSNIIRQ